MSENHYGTLSDWWSKKYGSPTKQLATVERTSGVPSKITDEQIEYIRAINAKLSDDAPKYKHYFKDITNLNKIDIYRVLALWEVQHPCLQHAAKKILAAGNRGYKDTAKDVQEAIDSLLRWQEMQEEDNEGLDD